VVAEQNVLTEAVEQLRAELERVALRQAATEAELAELKAASELRLAAIEKKLRPPELVRRTGRVVKTRSQQLLRRRDGSGSLVDPVWYQMAYPDVAQSGADPADHYHRFGAAEGRNPNPLFDTTWYLETYPDVRDSGTDPLEHYHVVGWRERRNPSSVFDTAWYLETYSDVAGSNLNPLLHYLRFGATEGRLPRPGFEGAPILSPGLVRSREPASLPLRTLRRVRRQGVTGLDTATYPWTRSDLESSMPTGARTAVLQARGDFVAMLPDPPYTPFVPTSARVLHYVNSTSAIARLESLRAEGIEYLVATATSLASLPKFAAHVGRYEVVRATDRFSVYRLERRTDTERQSLAACLARVVQRVSAERGSEPAVLDLRPDPQPPLPGTFRAPEPRHLENYIAGTVDIVVSLTDEAQRAEANRIARSAVVLSDPAGQDATAIFLATDAARLPGVSIIIPTFEHEDMLRRCVTALGETVPSELEVEVIVVDDASGSPVSEEALEELAIGHPIRVVRNAINLGFVGSINRGAAAAHNEILLFLNNDTIALPGWLEPILTLFVARPDAGVVGGKLVYPDGRLQEAGGVMFSDASAANYGRGDPNVESSEYAFVREVDYVSGALLATPRALFESVGGLDTVYGFGYYDDSDYSFTLRRRGRPTLFQPRSVVVHLEGSSAGTSTDSGMKQFQVINRKIFAERWAAELRSQPYPPDQWRAGTLVPAIHDKQRVGGSAAA
jgi:GT2 family glycosyltransferase